MTQPISNNTITFWTAKTDPDEWKVHSITIEDAVNGAFNFLREEGHFQYKFSEATGNLFFDIEFKFGVDTVDHTTYSLGESDRFISLLMQEINNNHCQYKASYTDLNGRAITKDDRGKIQYQTDIETHIKLI